VISVVPYSPEHRAPWDAFVDGSKNATFLFRRGYMDYHADRFTDASLLFLEEGRLVALLPANAFDGAVQSHGGLTYGGVLADARMTAARMLEVFAAFRAHYRERGFETLLYKAIPHVYHVAPAEEDLYALFRCDARLVRRDIASAIATARPLPRGKGRKWGVKHAAKLGVTVRETTDFETFMQIDAELLQERYGATPVHSAEEIRLLAGRFPERIRLFGAFREGAMIGGVIVYADRRVAHAQYIAGTPEAKECCALDAVLDHLVSEVYKDKAYFDFGISTEQAGHFLNEGLIQNKETWGARAIVYDFYEMDLR